MCLEHFCYKTNSEIGCLDCNGGKPPFLGVCLKCNMDLPTAELKACGICKGKNDICKGGGFCDNCVRHCPTGREGCQLAGPWCWGLQDYTCSKKSGRCPGCRWRFTCTPETSSKCQKWFCPKDHSCDRNYGSTCYGCGLYMCEKCQVCCQDEDQDDEEDSKEEPASREESASEEEEEEWTDEDEVEWTTDMEEDDV